MPGAKTDKKQRCSVVTTEEQTVGQQDCIGVIPQSPGSHNCQHYPPDLPPLTPHLNMENLFLYLVFNLVFPRGQGESLRCEAGQDNGMDAGIISNYIIKYEKLPALQP